MLHTHTGLTYDKKCGRIGGRGWVDPQGGGSLLFVVLGVLGMLQYLYLHFGLNFCCFVFAAIFVFAPWFHFCCFVFAAIFVGICTLVWFFFICCNICICTFFFFNFLVGWKDFCVFKRCFKCLCFGKSEDLLSGENSVSSTTSPHKCCTLGRSSHNFCRSDSGEPG